MDQLHMPERQTDVRDRIVEAFRSFDTNGDGIIDRNELKEVFKRLASGAFSDEDVDRLVQAADTNQDGRIQYEEFVVWIMSAGDGTHSARHAARGCFQSAQWVHIRTGAVSDYYDIAGGAQLGEGGFGSVRQAVSKTTKVARAIKSIPKSDVDRKVVEHEVAIMKQLDHPNIIHLFEVYEDVRNFHLVMQLCTGGELFDHIIENDEVTEKQVASVMRQILRGVQYMHSKAICHRDIKPENFLLRDRGASLVQCEIKIIDFGLAAEFTEGTVFTDKKGTPDYVCPEIIRGRYNHLCDLWSCGVVMYVLFAGHLPFTGEDDNDQALYDAILKQPLEFDPEVFDYVSKDAQELIFNMLTKDPLKRCTAEWASNHRWIAECAPQANNVPLRANEVGNMRAFCGQGKLKKAAMHLIARRIDGDDVQELKRMFASLDADANGQVSYDELLAALNRAGLGDPAARSNARWMLDELDVSWSGGIGWTEFLAATLDKKYYEEERVCRAAFHVFDRDGSGKIDRKEIAQVLHNIHEDVWQNSSAVAQIMEQYDLDHDNAIDFEEFMKMMRAGCT